MTTKTDSREIALDVLLEILENGGMSHLVLNQALTKYRYLEKQDRAFITRTVEGTLEYVIQLDAVIDRFSSVKTERQKPLIRTLLRMSVYQILYMERVPDPAVCNEAVKLAKKRRFAGLSGFVNAVRGPRKGDDRIRRSDAPLFGPALDVRHVGGRVRKGDRGADRRLVSYGTSAHGAVQREQGRYRRGHGQPA